VVQDKILLTPKLKIGNLLLNFIGIFIQTPNIEIDKPQNPKTPKPQNPKTPKLKQAPLVELLILTL
jgi:hypothetical protein